MRAADEPGSDGPPTSAPPSPWPAPPPATGRPGRFGDEVHLATRVTKRHSPGLLAFGSPDLRPGRAGARRTGGLAGAAAADEIRRAARRRRRAGARRSARRAGPLVEGRSRAAEGLAVGAWNSGTCRRRGCRSSGTRWGAGCRWARDPHAGRPGGRPVRRRRRGCRRRGARPAVVGGWRTPWAARIELSPWGPAPTPRRRSPARWANGPRPRPPAAGGRSCRAGPRSAAPARAVPRSSPRRVAAAAGRLARPRTGGRAASGSPR